MIRMSALLLTLSAAIVLTGCASARMGTTGLLYSDVQSGLTATSNQAGNRMGEACANSILGLFATGDATIETARRNGGITMITSVDESNSNIFFFYSKYCVIVRGR